MNLDLQRELLAMRTEDFRVREELASAGELDFGYHAKMEAVHKTNAARLRAIVEQHGWPGNTLVGDDGAEAAWLILQHAIAEPELQRGYFPLLLQAAERGQIPRWQPAYLLDRICFFEDRPQIYGTHTDFDDDGKPRIYPLQHPDRVNDLRSEAGLSPLVPIDQRENPPAPISPGQARIHRQQMDEWARHVGWRK